MKKLLAISGIIQSALFFSGCEFIGDVFKTGVWVGVIIIIAVIALIAFIVKIFFK